MATEGLVNKNNQSDDQEFIKRRKIIGKEAIMLSLIAVSMSIFPCGSSRSKISNSGLARSSMTDSGGIPTIPVRCMLAEAIRLPVCVKEGIR